MQLKIEIDEKRLLGALEKAPKSVFREIRPAMIDAMEDVARDARANHRFTTRSGNLERFTVSEVSDTGLTGKVRIDDRNVPYGKYIHRGFRSWRPDQFVTKAFEGKKKDTINMIQKAVNDGIRAAGL